MPISNTGKGETTIGYLPLSRKLFEHGFWKEKRAFSRFEAWLDLLATARFDNSEGTCWIDFKGIKFYRGEVVASLRYLAKRWEWSVSKVNRFLLYLQDNQMINRRTEAEQTIIRISNYEVYNRISANAGQIDALANSTISEQKSEHLSEHLTEHQNPRQQSVSVPVRNSLRNTKRNSNETPPEQLRNKSNKVNKVEIKEKSIQGSFEEFWISYDYKVNKPATEKKWKRLTEEEHKKILEIVPEYTRQTPDKKYRKHPLTFLNARSWEDELTYLTPKFQKNGSNDSSSPTRTTANHREAGAAAVVNDLFEDFGMAP